MTEVDALWGFTAKLEPLDMFTIDFRRFLGFYISIYLSDVLEMT